MFSVAAASMALGSMAQDGLPYPTRPIRVIAPAVIGSPPDVVARLVGEKLANEFKYPIVVDNRPGASGVLGLEALAKAPSDGHTLGAVGMVFMAVTPRLLPSLRFDTARDFTPITIIAWNYNVLVVPASSNLNDVSQLISAAKSRPGQLRYASGGNGTPAHLGAELLKREAGIDLRHIPFKGGPAAALALLTGDADLMIGAVGAVSPSVKGGRLRALATSAPKRIKTFPELPTFVEAGYSQVVVRDWQAFIAPTGTSPVVLERLNGAILKAIAAPDVRGRLELLGMEPAELGLQHAAAQMRADIQDWARLINELGIKAD
jgi:tripartite-type tricarboxylate transporter receptor subunit TctC